MHKIANDSAGARAPSALIAIAAISTGLDKLVNFTLFGGVNISLQILVMLFSALYALYYLSTGGRMRISIPYLFVMLIMLGYFLFEALRSGQPERALSYVVMLCLCVTLFITISSNLNRSALFLANKYIFLIGAVLVGAQLARFVYVLIFNQDQILHDRSLWDVGANDVYEVIHGRHLAFQGFSGDPNQVGAAVAIVLFAGMSIKFQRADYMRHLICALLAAAIFVSYSRGAIISLLLSYMVVFAVTKNRVYKIYLIIFAGVFVGGLVATLSSGDLTGAVVNPLTKFNYHFGRRFSEWMELLTSFSGSPIIGCGLRCDEIILGKYAENTYLGLMINAGALGLLLYLMVIIAGYANLILFSRRVLIKSNEYLPWLAYSTYLLLTMFFVSMDVKLHLWLAAAVMYSLKMSSDRKAERETPEKNIKAAI